jgi:DNA polymerase-3 subunit alpha
MKFPGYFLIVADFIKWAKAAGYPVGPGRGSGAGSLVAYALTITDVDPLRFSLLFERFLNPERVSMPDFDIDFCQDRREEVIRYVQQKYGREQVARSSPSVRCRPAPHCATSAACCRCPMARSTRFARWCRNNPANPTPLSKAIEERAEALQEEAEKEPVVARCSTSRRRSKGSTATPRPTPPASSSATGRCRSSCRCTAIRARTCRSPSST